MKVALLQENAEIDVGGVRKYPNLPLKEDPLTIVDRDIPTISADQVLIRVHACGVCYTDVDIIEGRLKCKLPVVPGHQVVGRVVATGSSVGEKVKVGDRVGVAWISWSCGKCYFCLNGQENLCGDFKGTGCHVDGGYGEYMVAHADYVYRVPDVFNDYEAAPLLCAGAVGYRALKLANMRDGLRLGLFGFGSSAHIIIQIVKKYYPSSEVYVFSRSEEHRDLARRLGADWTGMPSENPPRKLDRAIDFTPVGETIPRALELLERGGRLVANVIRKQTPVNLDYANHLWMEREVKTVANVTRSDVREFLEVAASIPIKPEVRLYRFEEVNKALRDLKAARIKGSPVLAII